MSCIACEIYAARITNIYRDEDLKLKYTEFTGLQVSKLVIKSLVIKAKT